MTPTLAQLKKRPALWIIVNPDYVVKPRITLPNGNMWAWHTGDWHLCKTDGWHNHAKNHYEFAGWL